MGAPGVPSTTVTIATDQSRPNALELALLQAIALEHPAMAVDVDRLNVRARRYTGVGSYTDFDCFESGECRTVNLKARVVVPGVPNGIGAVAYCRGDQIQCLETFTHGDDRWNGAFEGFSIG